ncbi:MAG: AMP-binding protein, partial [Candidatus Freyarchaeota archaeon]
MSGEKKSKELPEYIKNRIWLKTYPEGYPAEVEIPEDKDLYRIVDEARKKWGDEVNMIFYGRKVTRNEIADGADRLATALHDLGVRKGDTVAIYLPNCPQFPMCYLLDMFYPNLEQIMDEVKLKNIIVVNIMGKKPNVEKKPGVYYFDELLERYPPDPPKVEIKPKEDIAVLQYTGGTTGLPKGAML